MATTGILVIGATGYMGRHVATAAAKEPGVKAYALIRKATEGNPKRQEAIEELRTAGVQFLEGDLYDHASLVAAFKHVSVVISTVGAGQVADQTKIIDAAKEAGTIKRILPSEFGILPSDKTVKALGELPELWATKEKVIHALSGSGIPYTLIWANVFAGYFVPGLGNLGGPAKDEVNVFGTGDVQGVIVDEGDIGKYAIKAALDPRTANKTVRIQPPKNLISQNDLIALTEKLRGKKYGRKHVSDEELVQQYKTGGDMMTKLGAFLHYFVWVAGDCVQPPAEGQLFSADLYPDGQYKSVEAILGALN